MFRYIRCSLLAALALACGPLHPSGGGGQGGQGGNAGASDDAGVTEDASASNPWDSGACECTNDGGTTWLSSACYCAIFPCKTLAQELASCATYGRQYVYQCANGITQLRSPPQYPSGRTIAYDAQGTLYYLSSSSESLAGPCQSHNYVVLDGDYPRDCVLVGDNCDHSG